MRSRLQDAVEVLRRAGASVVEFDIPLFRELCIARIVTFAAELAVLNRKTMQSDPESLERTTRELASVGYTYTAVDYVQAQRVRRAGQHALAGTFGTLDVIVTPTTAGPAPLLRTGPDPDLTRTDPTGLNAYCGIWNAAGNPALSIPAGFNAAGLPLGIQLVGRPFEDEFVLHVGEVFQNLTDWHLRAPPFPAPALDDRGVDPGSPANDAEKRKDPALAPDLARALAELPRLYGVNLAVPEVETLARILPARRATIAAFDAISEGRIEELTPVFRAVP